MHSKFKYFIIIFTFVAIVFITSPTKVNASTFSGNASYYVQQGNFNGVPTSYSSGHSGLNYSSPTQTYFSLPAIDTNNQITYVLKEIDYSNSNYTFKQNSCYNIKLIMNYGSYMKLTYALYNYSNNRNITYCPNGTCSVSWTDGNAESTANITYCSSTNHTGLTLAIGTLGTTNNMVMFNSSVDYTQGIRIHTATIEEVQNSVDFSPIINNDNQNTQNIINNINNNNQKLEDINNTLTDDNITANADADFFDNINLFEDNTLSGIITAPLTYLRSIDGTCSPITLTYKSSNITLPCGDTIFWGRNDVSSFRTFWNILFGGYIIYRLCFKLFKTINDALDPTKDDIGGVAV